MAGIFNPQLDGGSKGVPYIPFEQEHHRKKSVITPEKLLQLKAKKEIKERKRKKQEGEVENKLELKPEFKDIYDRAQQLTGIAHPSSHLITDPEQTIGGASGFPGTQSAPGRRSSADGLRRQLLGILRKTTSDGHSLKSSLKSVEEDFRNIRVQARALLEKLSSEGLLTQTDVTKATDMIETNYQRVVTHYTSLLDVLDLGITRLQDGLTGLALYTPSDAKQLAKLVTLGFQSSPDTGILFAQQSDTPGAIVYKPTNVLTRPHTGKHAGEFSTITPFYAWCQKHKTDTLVNWLKTIPDCNDGKCVVNPKNLKHLCNTLLKYWPTDCENKYLIGEPLVNYEGIRGSWYSAYRVGEVGNFVAKVAWLSDNKEQQALLKSLGAEYECRVEAYKRKLCAAPEMITCFHSRDSSLRDQKHSCKVLIWPKPNYSIREFIEKLGSVYNTTHIYSFDMNGIPVENVVDTIKQDLQRTLYYVFLSCQDLIGIAHNYFSFHGLFNLDNVFVECSHSFDPDAKYFGGIPLVFNGEFVNYRLGNLKAKNRDMNQLVGDSHANFKDQFTQKIHQWVGTLAQTDVFTTAIKQALQTVYHDIETPGALAHITKNEVNQETFIRFFPFIELAKLKLTMPDELIKQNLQIFERKLKNLTNGPTIDNQKLKITAFVLFAHKYKFFKEYDMMMGGDGEDMKTNVMTVSKFPKLNSAYLDSFGVCKKGQKDCNYTVLILQKNDVVKEFKKKYEESIKNLGTKHIVQLKFEDFVAPAEFTTPTPALTFLIVPNFTPLVQYIKGQPLKAKTIPFLSEQVLALQRTLDRTSSLKGKYGLENLVISRENEGITFADRDLLPEPNPVFSLQGSTPVPVIKLFAPLERPSGVRTTTIQQELLQAYRERGFEVQFKFQGNKWDSVEVANRGQSSSSSSP